MSETTKAIVFSSLRYKDTSLIVKCFTENLGITSYLLKGIYGKKKSGLKPALFQPLTLLEITANHRKAESLNYIKEARVYYSYSDIQTNIYKNSIVLFLSEILSALIQEEEENYPLFRYIELALVWLDEAKDFSNFHLLFLLNLTQYLGCYPDVSDSHLPYFDLQSGKFTSESQGKHSLDGEKIVVFKSLLGINFDGLDEVKLNGNQRSEYLTIMLDYFKLHLFDFKQPKSLEVLTNLFR